MFNTEGGTTDYSHLSGLTLTLSYLVEGFMEGCTRILIRITIEPGLKAISISLQLHHPNMLRQGQYVLAYVSCWPITSMSCRHKHADTSTACWAKRKQEVKSVHVVWGADESTNRTQEVQ